MVLQDYYNKTNQNLTKFLIKKTLILSISIKNKERRFLTTKLLNKVDIHEDAYEKKKKIFFQVKKKLLKESRTVTFNEIVKKSDFLYNKLNNVLCYSKNMLNYYYCLWNFKKIKYDQLKLYKKIVIPQDFYYSIDRSYILYKFLEYSSLVNLDYKVKKSSYIKFFLNKFKKSLIKNSPLYPYFQYFSHLAFTQKTSLFYYFEMNRRTIRWIIYPRLVSWLLDCFIDRSKLKTLNILRYYRYQIVTKRKSTRR